MVRPQKKIRKKMKQFKKGIIGYADGPINMYVIVPPKKIGKKEKRRMKFKKLRESRLSENHAERNDTSIE
ncbi:hypothetical protein BG261_05190 [Floricoccus tropicus]|uniref:Uncharacterized protein n=1 Tax=Floricoccus tropicus TaxID=1859473 RepID=A0A1E8GKK8_9LACT|nr:hypothetical protein [Floricoccus tropicus]OFI48784.1 hypothetical protein BG261_05190 [Floricoccus tropicus]